MWVTVTFRDFHSNLENISLWTKILAKQWEEQRDWQETCLLLLLPIIKQHQVKKKKKLTIFLWMSLSQDRVLQNGSTRGTWCSDVLCINTEQTCMKAIVCSAMNESNVKRVIVSDNQRCELTYFLYFSIFWLNRFMAYSIMKITHLFFHSNSFSNESSFRYRIIVSLQRCNQWIYLLFLSCCGTW